MSGVSNESLSFDIQEANKRLETAVQAFGGDKIDADTLDSLLCMSLGVLSGREIKELYQQIFCVNLRLKSGERLGISKKEFLHFLVSSSAKDYVFLSELKDVLQTKRPLLFCLDDGKALPQGALGLFCDKRLGTLDWGGESAIYLRENQFSSRTMFATLRHEMRHFVALDDVLQISTPFKWLLYEADAGSLVMQNSLNCIFMDIYLARTIEAKRALPCANAFEVQNRAFKRARVDFINLYLNDAKGRFAYYEKLAQQGVLNAPRGFFESVYKSGSYEFVSTHLSREEMLDSVRYLKDALVIEKNQKAWFSYYANSFGLAQNPQELSKADEQELQNYALKNFNQTLELNRQALFHNLNGEEGLLVGVEKLGRFPAWLQNYSGSACYGQVVRSFRALDRRIMRCFSSYLQGNFYGY